jgi:branched-subunit amino acid ABC-type transport system permease component
MKATQQNETAAALMGIKTNQIRMITWGISAAVGSVAGLLMAPVLMEPYMMWDPMLKGFAGAVVGGMTSLPGAVFGAYIIGVSMMGVDSGAFWSQMRPYVEVADVMEGVVKSIVFGVAVSVLAVFEGYNAFPTAEGVSRATTRTVVISAIVVLILDFMITAILI